MILNVIFHSHHCCFWLLSDFCYHLAFIISLLDLFPFLPPHPCVLYLPVSVTILLWHRVSVGPGCQVPATTTSADSPPSSQSAPPPPPPPLPPLHQPALQSQPPSLSSALLRPPLSSLPYLLSSSCLSYSLLSASLGATRSVVMPTNTPAFSPIIPTSSSVKNDVPIVQDAAGTYPISTRTLQL